MKAEYIKKLEQAIKENEAKALKSDCGREVMKIVNQNIGLKQAIEIIKK